MPRVSAPYQNLKKLLLEISYLSSALAVLGWDEQVYMPPKGVTRRAKTSGYLSGLIHEKFTSKEFAKALLALERREEAGKLTEAESVVLRETYRDWKREKKLPRDFVEELARTTSEAHQIWAASRAKSDFKLFLPVLEKIVGLKRKEAEYVGYKDHPYDALLDDYEPGATASDIAVIFGDLKKFLVPFVQKIMASEVKVDPGILKGKFPKEKQEKFNLGIARKIGFDFEAGRLDASHHPFTQSFHPEDVRLTTRYAEDNIFYSLGSTIHEVGHGLYEQGLNPDYFGLPLGESVSLGIHESQSRVWENQIGKSLSFWKYFYPALQKTFPKPFKSINLEDFYKAINYVTPSLIRTESDEVTYNLHIILRFEIEKELIEGSINPKDLPEVWNAKIKEYFGLDVPNDALGVLQDVHWSGGAIGYFPTYALGNLYAAQFYSAMLRDIPDLNTQIKNGEFANILDWLRKKIHQHGKFHTAEALCLKITGEPVNSKYFIDYIKTKYYQIYRV